MKIKGIIEAMEAYAPLELAVGWDNVGLMLGSADFEVSRVMLCVDVTDEVIDEAVKNGCQLIISHHPFIFTGLKSIDFSHACGKGIQKLIKNDISVYSAHTNLDFASLGVNYYMNKALSEVFCSNIEEFARKVKQKFEAVTVSIVYADGLRQDASGVKAEANGFVSACGSFDGDFDRVINSGVNLLVTGEIKYHDVLTLSQNGINVIEIGHFDSEKIILPYLQGFFGEKFDSVEFYLTTDKFNYIII